MNEKQQFPDVVEEWSGGVLPRFNSMTPRLQARLVKMFGWQFKPGFDFYLWVDSSCRLSRPDSSRWFMEQLGDKDIAVFKHNKRKTVQEEADYLKERLSLEKEGKKQVYILPRYENEDIDGALSEIDPSGLLLASTSFIYRSNKYIRDMMKEWWYQTSRYHSIDQLSFTHALEKVEYSVIDMDYLKCPYLEYMR